ncbi:MAG: aldehyde dehydrogenase family protein, partial [Gammaproteobacteria bacterium]
PFIVKPAEATPLSCITLVGILREAGLPNPWGQVIHCDHDVAEQMVADERIAFFSFIGSSRVGWHLRSKLAAGAHCTLEHGGAAPVIVTDNSDWEAAIPMLLKGGLYHAGQVCVSVQRIFAHTSIARSLAEKMAESARQFKVGPAVDETTDIGPLIRPSEVQRVHQWVSEARERGGELLCGGQPVSETCYPATILYNPPSQCNISQKEVFGPVIAIYSYSDFDEAIERANHPDFAFQSAIFTRDLDLAFQAADRLTAKTVLINEHTAFRVDWMPFGGFKKSGLGTGGIGYTLKDMMIEKMIVIRH